MQDETGHLKRDMLGLAPGGVCRASVITAGAVVSYTTFSPFSSTDAEDVCFL
jgi:hypothetical protein